MSKTKTKPVNDAKSIFVANVKGGVGKSTLSIMLARELATRIPPQNITVIDTDLQRTATEFLTNSNPEINLEFLPVHLLLKIQIYRLFNNSLSRTNLDLGML